MAIRKNREVNKMSIERIELGSVKAMAQALVEMKTTMKKTNALIKQQSNIIETLQGTMKPKIVPKEVKPKLSRKEKKIANLKAELAKLEGTKIAKTKANKPQELTPKRELTLLELAGKKLAIWSEKAGKVPNVEITRQSKTKIFFAYNVGKRRIERGYSKSGNFLKGSQTRKVIGNAKSY